MELPCPRTTMFSNSFTLVRRPGAFTVKESCWSGGAGCAPILPAGFTAFWACTASITSRAVMFRAAIFSGFSQMRMA